MELIIRKASVRWKGGSRGGTTALITGNGAHKHAKLPLGPASETDAAQLIAAAHASSFSLALAHELKLKPDILGEIVTTATVTVERLHASSRILNIHLNVVAHLPDVTQKKFIDAAVSAKNHCLIARSLPPDISICAKLDNGAAGHSSTVLQKTKSNLQFHSPTNQNVRSRNLHLQTARNGHKSFICQRPLWNGRWGR